MPRSIVALSFLSVMLGCSTLSRLDTKIDKKLTPPASSFLTRYKNATAQELSNLAVGANEQNIRWWKNYTLASKLRTTDAAQSCSLYKDLSNEEEFPLNDLSLLRAYEICSDEKGLKQLPSAIAPWYNDLFVEIQLKEALESEDLNDDVEAFVLKARKETNKKIKEEYYLKALMTAQKLNSQEKIAEVQAALYKNSPRLDPQPALKDLSAVAMDYRFHRDFDSAVAAYEKILKAKGSNDNDKFQALRSLRQTYKVAQRKTEYIKATDDLVEWTAKNFRKNKKDRRATARYHDALMLNAKALWTESQVTKAVQNLQRALKDLKGFYPLDEVYFILGRIEEEKGRFEEAITHFELSYNQPVSMTGLRDKIAWLKSWNYYKLEKWNEAKDSFTEMRDSVKDPSDKARARFWLSRTYQKLNLPQDATQELEVLKTEDPMGYYGVLAIRELKQNYPPLRDEAQDLEKLSLLGVSEIPAQNRLVAEWLIAVKEKAFAEQIISKMAESLRQNKVTSEETWLAMSSGFARSGLYLPLFAAIGALQPEVKDKLLKDHPDLLFPLAFKDIVADASQKSGTPSEFILSIIRQESAFNPEARSPADAFGLMQLLPSVAKQLAKENKLEYAEASDLFIPEINVPLGAFELKNLMKRYNNQFILAVSGYNANHSAIRGWLKTRYREDSVEFIEEVPYEETRAYIKLVMRNYVFYKRLGTQEAIQFPEDLLKLSPL